MVEVAYMVLDDKGNENGDINSGRMQEVPAVRRNNKNPR
jgi:hypothetical protein